MSKQFFDFSNTKCVVLCAGRGKRLEELTANIPKVMIKIRNTPILELVIDFWRKFTNKFVFVVGYKKEYIIRFLKKYNDGIKYEIVIQEEPKGIAQALYCAKDCVPMNFILVLGDCICKGHFIFPRNMEQGCGVWKTPEKKYIFQSYLVEVKKDIIKKVVEKPSVVKTNLCGMGFYFFNRSIFKYIEETPPSSLRGEVEITDVIQRAIDSGKEISAIFFKGDYINITHKEDLELANKIF